MSELLTISSHQRENASWMARKYAQITGKKLSDLAAAFWCAVECGHYESMSKAFEAGLSVNERHPVYESPVLHSLAAIRARPAIRQLVSRDGVDFLARDKKGRLASELAYLYGHDPALARLLGNKERKQAEAQGIKLTRRPPPEP